MKIVQFGAGNIGRSLVGQLFARAGWDVVFVDTVPEVIDALNRERAYDVIVKDDRPDTIRVEGVRGMMAGDTDAIAREIADADMIGTAVGPNALPYIYPTLAQGIGRRNEPIDVLMCENLRGAARQAREAVEGRLNGDCPIGFIETSIGKMVPIMPEEVRRERPLEVWAEAYNQIIADGDAFVREIPDVPGLVVKSCFDAYVDRKLFIHNLGHAVSAFFGYPRGYTYIWECMDDEAVRAQARGAMDESARALIARYPSEFNEDNQREHVEDLLRRFHNRALGDTVYRVGRDLYRKLAPDDRVIGALRMDRSQGIDPEYTIAGLVQGLRFQATDESGEPFPRDAEFAQALQQNGVRWVLTHICGLNEQSEGELIERVAAAYG